MSITRLALRFAVPVPQLEQFESFLFVGPHPDDIEIGAGATAAKLAAAGKKVTFLICTDGRFGDGASGGVRGDALAELRKKESIASAAMLGVSDVRFLMLRDGAGYSIETLEHELARVVGELQPQVLFAPDPNSRSECHPDHLNVGLAVRKIACMAPYPGIMAGMSAAAAPVEAVAFYMTAEPNCYVASGKRLSLQCSAIFGCHKSQYPDGSEEAKAIALYLKLRSVDFGFRALAPGGAEGFRVLGRTHMHCLPEAGLKR